MDVKKSREAFVTLATNDAYSQGAIVLAQSLRDHGTMKEIAVMITPQVSSAVRFELASLFDQIIMVDVMDSKDEAHLSSLQRPELGVTFTKLHCWKLTEYEKCVFMDADTMVLTNIDDLFEREELSASPDAGWPDMFNSGVFVYQPSIQTFISLIVLADMEGSFDGGDQGLLNSFFHNWYASDSSKRLPFVYNMHSTTFYTYLPAFAKFGKDTKVVHFIGLTKPWHYNYDCENGIILHPQGSEVKEDNFLKIWWRLRQKSRMKVHEQEELDQIEKKFACISFLPSIPAQCLSEGCSFEEKKSRLWLWQASRADYAGKDCFANIEAQVDRVLQSGNNPPQ